MSQAKDTLLRLFALLRLIPTDPQRIASTTLLEKLRDRGFSVTLRSIQRDLNRLSLPFSLQCDESESPFRWSFTRDAPLRLEDMDAPTALALSLSESHLTTLLPQTVLDQLSPQFRRARNFLGDVGHNGLADWARRVRAIPNGKTLLPAAIAPEIWRAVSASLLESRQIEVAYHSRSKGDLKQLVLHPVGLVSRHAISYLLASVDGYEDLRQFALHRIHSIRMLETKAKEQPTFNIDDYIARGRFSQRQGDERVELVADIHPKIAELLSETPLSDEQSLDYLPGQGCKRLRAWVPLDRETLWWIFALNENIRVHAPQVWVEEIRQRLKSMQQFYLNQDPPVVDAPSLTSVGTAVAQQNV